MQITTMLSIYQQCSNVIMFYDRILNFTTKLNELWKITISAYSALLWTTIIPLGTLKTAHNHMYIYILTAEAVTCAQHWKELKETVLSQCLHNYLWSII